MKKSNFLLSALTGVGIAATLLGCSGDGVNPPLDSQTQPVPARMVATYSLSTGNIPLPNDLLFAGTQDLTLNIPVVDPEDYSDPKVALGSIDGWSAVAPFSISFSSRDANLGLNPATVIGGSTVRVYKTGVYRPEIAPGVIAPTGPVTNVERELVSGLEYVVQAVSPTSIAIVPTVPFEEQASYMVVLTNGLQDSDGLPILHDAQYAIVQSPNPIAEDSTVAALEPVRQLVNAMNGAASASEGGPAVSDIIMSYQFTVGSVGAVMQSAKGLYIDKPIFLDGNLPSTSFTSLGVSTAVLGLPGTADLYKGTIDLTYLLGIPSEENPAAPLNTFWKALPTLPIGPEGGPVPNPFGINLSYANSYPRANGVETVPLLVSVPNTENCPKPDAGYPVAIFQHGITANRTNLVAIADSLAAACTVGIAMDMPIHGIAEDNLVRGAILLATEGASDIFEGYDAGQVRERTFGIDFIDNATGAPGPDGNVDPSGAHTINLSNLLVSRDNTRQSILDLLYLEKAIGFMDIDGDGPDFDATNISYIGHSLGGMVGTGVIAYSDLIKSASLANPGGGIALLLNGSETFGPRIRAGVAAAAGMEVTDPAFPAVLNQFLFVTQAVLDSGDPINTAAHAVSNNVPTLMLQNLNDAVVPNSVAGAPLSGTMPLARVLGLSDLVIDEESNIALGSRLFSKLNQGLHSSVLSPNDEEGEPTLLNVTVEMQREIVSFLASGGNLVQVTDPTLHE